MTDVRVAFFDFDGTLSRGDSILPFLLWCIRRREAPVSQLFRAAGGWLKQRRDPGKTVRAKEITLSFLTGRSRRELERLADRFWQERLVKGLFPKGQERMRQLKAQGFTIVIVSASPSCYMDRLPAYLPADAVLCTDCHIGADGCFDGHVGANCKGDEKPKRIRRWLKENGLPEKLEDCQAYGDSPSDAPMLAMVGHPVAVNPHRRLTEAVPGAEIVRWRTGGSKTQRSSEA